MVHESRSHDFAYVECDIPPGVTIAQWRAQRAAERPPSGRRAIAAARRRLCHAADWIWGAGARALAGPRIARVRVRSGRHRAPRPAEPLGPGAPP